MECPNCKTKNPETRKFCRECGYKLLPICPQCSFENLPGDKFCGECGFDLQVPQEALKELSFDEKIDKIQRYLPKGITEKILSQKGKIEGERKQVTVLFCDLVGFTSLVEKLSPEKAYNMMDQIYEILIHKVHAYEGTVNEMTGDGIMALFGAPIALEDAPQRAIRSSLSIHRGMAEFNERMKQENDNFPQIKMRIGIHSGPVVVGTLGNDLRVEFKAVGDTVNLASRMESLAEPGTTYITGDTFKLTEGLFRFEALGRRKIRGKDESAQIFRVIAASSQRTRFDVSAERGLTPFVGRERELAILLEGFERVKTGRGQAFFIMSDAGVGKSRLLYEFRKAMANEDVIFMEGKCLSYSRSVAYHPIIDIVKSNFEIVERDGDSEIKEKIQRGLKTLAAEKISTFPYLLELLGVKETGLIPYSSSPEAKKNRIIEALNHIIIRASQMRPLIIAIEDLHWVDKSSEDSLKALLANISGERVFLILTYRPEYINTWGTKTYFNHLNLNRLYSSESLTMATHLLGTEKIRKELEELIIEKTEGVPFFIEEFIKSLKDLRIIERKNNTYHLTKDIKRVAIPSTIQDVIMARVDSLLDRTKEILQICSVIEREFDFKLLKLLTKDFEQNLLSNLSLLKESELLYERGIRPNSTFIFRHSLIREVVYDSILTKIKKELHEKIGKAIEVLYKEHLDMYYEILAEHFFHSNGYEKAYEYSVLACKKAEKTASLNNAINHARRGIIILKKFPQTEEVQRSLIDIKTKLGIYFSEMYDTPRAMKSVESVIDLALRYDYKKRLSQIYTIFAHYYSIVEEDFSKSIQYYEDAIKIAEDTEDVMSSVFANYGYGVTLSFFVCDFEKGYRLIKKALDFNVAANNLWGISAIKGTLSYFNYFIRGKIDLSYDTSKDAMLIANKSGDINSKAIAHTCLGISLYGLGNLKEAEGSLLHAIELCEKCKIPLWTLNSYFYIAEIYYDLCCFQESIIYLQKTVTLTNAYNILPSTKYQCKIAMARVKVRNNEEIDLDSLYSYVKHNRFKSNAGQILRYIAEIYLYVNNKHISDAENCIKKAIEQDKQNGTMYQLSKDYVIYGELFKRKKDLSQARENFKLGIEIFKKCGADGWVEKYEKELAEF